MATGNSNDPTLTLPVSEQVAGDGTIAVTGVSYTDSFAQTNAGALYLGISDTSGILSGYYPASGGSGAAAAGNGSNAIIFQGSYTDVEDIINSLTYAATTNSGSDTITFDIWNQAGVETTGTIPVTITSSVSGNGPTLREPQSESVTSAGTVAVSGSYSDKFAATNPGALYLSISDTSGTLYANYTNGGTIVAAPGSGSNALVFQGSYQDVQAILASLIYVGGAAAGSDSIQFDIWDQAGVETTATVAMTVTGQGNGNTETWTGAVDSDWNNAGNWSNGAVPGPGGTAVIPADTAHNATLSNATLDNETITLDDSNGVPTVNFTNVTLGAGSLLDGNGGQIALNGTLTIAAGATYAPTGFVTVNRGVASNPTTIVNDGTITNGSSNLITLGDTLVNNGTIIDSQGQIEISGTLFNNGVADIWGGRLEVDGTIVGGTIDLSGGGSLLLSAPMATDHATINGFSNGDLISDFNSIDSLTYNDNTLDIFSSGTLVQAIQFGGGLFLGNFEIEHAINVPVRVFSGVEFAASGQHGNAFSSDTADIASPGTATIGAGGTLSLSSVNISNVETMTLSITASSGTLYMNGASGSGTDHLTIGAETSQSQINADLSSLVYVAGPYTGLATVTITADAPVSQGGTIETTRAIPVGVLGGVTGPALTEPSSETVSPGGTVAVSGRYTDGFAQGNPGQLYLAISDSSGTLSATDASGQAVAGSGSNQIGLATDYVGVNAILSSLHYTAGTNSGSDTISFEVWNQAGTESTGTTAITIDPPATGASMTMADFVAPTSGSSAGGGVLPGSNSPAGSAMLTPQNNQPIGVPLVVPHG